MCAGIARVKRIVKDLELRDIMSKHSVLPS